MLYTCFPSSRFIFYCLCTSNSRGYFVRCLTSVTAFGLYLTGEIQKHFPHCQALFRCLWLILTKHQKHCTKENSLFGLRHLYLLIQKAVMWHAIFKWPSDSVQIKRGMLSAFLTWFVACTKSVTHWLKTIQLYQCQQYKQLCTSYICKPIWQYGCGEDAW